MGRRIVKQPNGLYAVYSTVIDGFIITNSTKEELIEDFVQEKREEITEMIEASIEVMNTGERNYQAMPVMKFEDAFHVHNQRHDPISLETLTNGL
jgi:hypothetical protein